MARCEQIVWAEYGGNQEVLKDMLFKCDQPKVTAMMDARSSDLDTGNIIKKLLLDKNSGFLIGAIISALAALLHSLRNRIELISHKYMF